MTNTDYKFLTYKEAAEALSTSVETVRVQARRYHWQKRKNNQNKITVGVPIERLSGSKIVSEQTITTSNQVHDLQKQVAVLETELKNAQETIVDLKEDRDAWRQQAQSKRFWFWKKVS